ncbi:hypothetical protein [Streptosporangium sp. H16]|uniref:hypothetical protein n=1 Tax=Streptosporangium sp. H16 TaxID=3444184 RepID=UPI003F79AEAC
MLAVGSASSWGFGLYLASSGKYENQILPTGLPIGTAQEALDCACDLYLDYRPPGNFRAGPLSVVECPTRA